MSPKGTVRLITAAAFVVSAILLPALVISIQRSPLLAQKRGLNVQNDFPRFAGSDLAFDRYLDQVIAGQDAAGTLPALAPPTLRGTCLAVRALQEIGFGADVDSAAVQAFVQSCYNASSGLFADAATNAVENGTRVSGYSAIEGTYYAFATLDLLGTLLPANWLSTVNAIDALQDVTGGFACRPGVCTTHDAYFAYKALELLGGTSSVNIDALASFLDGRQISDVDRWWEYGAFTNLPSTVGHDTDFTDPNLVSTYYAVATLAACGRLGTLNEAGLVQFVGLLRNATSGFFSYSAGNDRAEHVGTAFLLATDQFLANDGDINYAVAGTALLARLEQGYFNEGRRAPSNYTLSAACEALWGLAEGNRLPELSTGAKKSLHAFITSYYVTSGAMGGFALTRLATFHELAAIVPAIVGGGKMDLMDVDALYTFVKKAYIPLLAYFSPDGDAVLQRDLPACYNPTSPDGFLARGVGITLPALQVLKAVGRLNDFLGETHALVYLLGNITASQFLNISAPAVYGAFCGHAAFATECQGNEGWRAFISPQWSLLALKAIAILDPTNPTTHFNAPAAWSYISRMYVAYANSAYFSPPEWVNVTIAEWTCRVAEALCEAKMDGYFDVAKVNAWLVAHLDTTSGVEVAWHLRFLAVGAGLARAHYGINKLYTLQSILIVPGDKWYHAEVGTWPDTGIVRALTQLRADRQIYLLDPVLPDPMLLGGTNYVEVTVGNLFGAGNPPLATVSFTAMAKSVPLLETMPGRYRGDFRCTYNFSEARTHGWIIRASKVGWQTAGELTGSANFAGDLVASAYCGTTPALNGGAITVHSTALVLEVHLTTKLETTESPAANLTVIVRILAGSTLVETLPLAEASPGVYGGSYSPGAAGTFRVEVIVQERVLASFEVTTDGTEPGTRGGTSDPSGISAGILISSATGGVSFLGTGAIVRKRTSRKLKK